MIYMDEIDQLNVIVLWIKFDGSYYIYEWKITLSIWVNCTHIMGPSMIGVSHLNPSVLCFILFFMSNEIILFPIFIYAFKVSIVFIHESENNKIYPM